MSVPLPTPLLGFVAASGDCFNFGAQMERVIPGAEFVELDETHTIFGVLFPDQVAESAGISYFPGRARTSQAPRPRIL